ncbi:TniQ family protein [Streptomyces sp. MS1.AVA.3]|uniref:TniQ family protein n=1 Tax=Streptomyces decoyicus TaxID=249567 RepID=UPI0030C57286
MTQGTTGSPRARTTKPLRPSDLPIRVPLIHGETNASYLSRTAAANGLALPRLLKALHHGRLPGRGTVKVLPHLQEVHLSTDAVDRLTTLVERDQEQLQRALPGLHTAQLLNVPGAAIRITVWADDPGAGPLKACPLCLEDGAWLVAAGHRWRPCSCGRRWQCGDDGGYLIDTTPLPEIGRALQRHRAFDHKRGPAGDALVADAHQVTLWWWASKQFARDLWRHREDTLPVGPKLRRRQAAPAVVYPEAVRLAEAMDEWETRRIADPGASPREWLADIAERFGVPGLVDGRGNEPLNYWLELHPADPGHRPTGRTTAERRWSRLGALHHRPAEHGPFQARSCLRWTYGLPLTSTLELCPYCQGRAPSCYWSPQPDCPERLQST